VNSKPFRMWAVFDNYAICHITVPGAPYLSQDLRYSLAEYNRIMKCELHPQKKTEVAVNSKQRAKPAKRL